MPASPTATKPGAMERTWPSVPSTGIIDLHLHAGPDRVRRYATIRAIAGEAQQYGVVAAVYKRHDADTTSECKAVNETAPYFRAHGSIVLNRWAGDLSWRKAHSALDHGASFVWLPTHDAAHHLRDTGKEDRPGISLLDSHGRLRRNVRDIIETVASFGATLATGHIGVHELELVLEFSYRSGFRSLVVTHASLRKAVPLALQIAAARAGAFIEHSALATTRAGGGRDAAEIAAEIAAVGADACVLSSDLGQPANGHPLAGLLAFASQLQAAGCTAKDVETMLVRNPGRLLAQ